MSPPKFVRDPNTGIKSISAEWKAWKRDQQSAAPAAAAPAAAAAAAGGASTGYDMTPSPATQKQYSDGVVPAGAKIRLACAWDSDSALAMDIDAAVSVFDSNGMMLDVCYFNQLSIFNGAIVHSGDSVDGLATDEDEVITIDLSRVPAHVASIVFSWHCFSQGDFSGAKNSFSVITVDGNGAGVVQPPTESGVTSALILVLTKQSMEGVWALDKVPLERSTAKGPRTPLDCADLMMHALKVSPEMRKELAACVPKSLNMKKGDVANVPVSTTKIAMGLGWDSRVDVDASAVALGSDGSLIATCYFGDKKILSGAIVHSGDNTSGEGDGDDEVIQVQLDELPAKVAAVFFTVNVYSSSENFSSVKGEYCRLVDTSTKREFAKVTGMDSGSQNGFVMSCFTRTKLPGQWSFRAIGRHAAGRRASDLVDECQEELAKLRASK